MSNAGARATVARAARRALDAAAQLRVHPDGELGSMAVLDGRTLTGQAVVRGLRPQDYTDLLLVATRADGRRRAAVIGRSDGAGGSLTVSLAVPLEHPDGLDLRRGEWRVGLAYRTARGVQHAIPTTAATLAPGRPSPTLWNPRSPGSGRRYRPAVDRSGNLVINVVRFPTHAEVERVAVAGTELTITGRIVGSAKLAQRTERAPVVLVVARVGGPQRRRFPARVVNGTFTASLPLTRLRFDEAADWVVRLRIGNAKPLVVRRVLTDLREPAAVHRYPVARLPRRVRVTISYSDKTALLLQARRLPPREKAAP